MEFLVSQVFETLEAYVQQFEPQLDRSQVPALVRVILPTLPSGTELDHAKTLNLINQVVNRFDAQVAAAKTLTDSAKQSALQVAQQMTELRREDLAKQVLAGFQKKVGATIAQAELPSLVKTLLPEVPDLFLSHQDVKNLANRIINQIGPELVPGDVPIVQQVQSIAGLVNHATQKLKSENLVVDVLKSYGPETMKSLINNAALPDVIKTIVNAIDIKLGGQNGQVSIEEIAFKFKSGTTGAYVQPTAAQVARQVDDAVQGYLAQRSTQIQATDVTQPVVTTPQSPADTTGLGGLRAIEVHSNLKQEPSS